MNISRRTAITLLPVVGVSVALPSLIAPTAFDQWSTELAAALTQAFDMDGAEYIRQTGEECWREMFNDGLSPADAVSEEVYAAACSA